MCQRLDSFFNATLVCPQRRHYSLSTALRILLVLVRLIDSVTFCPPDPFGNQVLQNQHYAHLYTLGILSNDMPF